MFELATKGTKEVILIEMVNRIGKDIGRSTRWGMLQDVSRFGVTTDVQTRAVEITDTGVKVEREGAEEEIAADTIVLAGGAESYNPLQEIIQKKGITCEVVGDANQVATAFDAVHNGFLAGREI